ncbi:MAG: mandelate racemase/muconate lactonizing enzyme family protein [Pseudomonadota bacterium]
MSRIASIEISHHSMPLDPPFKASWDGRDRVQFDATVVRVRDEDGREGVGSGDLMLGFQGHEDLFVGRDPRDLSRHTDVLSHIDFHYGRPWPLDLALQDLAGQIAEEPVWRRLGGRSDRLRLYASSGVARDAEALADQAHRFVEEGFQGLKIRLSATQGGRGGWREDVKALEAVRARVGGALALMVDCNQGWRMPWDTAPAWTFKQALEVAKALEPLDITWLEEPLHRADLKGMAALRQATSIPIAGGEMTRELTAFRDLIEARALDILQPDCALVGGITGLARVAEAALAANLRFTPHSWTNGLGVLANAHLAAGAAGSEWFEWPHDPPEWSPERRDFLLAQPLERKGGVYHLPLAPGLGAVLDEDRLRATRLGDV